MDDLYVAYSHPKAKWIAEAAHRQITNGCGGGNFCPGSYVTRAAMAGLIVHAFDIPYKVDPATPRNIQFAYTQGLLTGVTGAVTYGTLSYYPNLLVSQVTHVNGMAETQANDPNEMRRPASLGASGSYSSWSSGTYGYDGAGNIKAIGNATFTYDSVNRLVASTLYDGPNSDGNQKQQSYTFDAFGNLTSIGGTSGRTTPTSPQTNRLNGTGTAYDAAGNLTNWNTAVYQYDDFNQMVHMTSGAEDWAYVYTADDERIWMYSISTNTSRWTIRDLNGKVLREYLNNKGTWSVGTDYIYRDGLLLAAETQSGQRHFHLDHLGTPRLITRAGGERVAYHVYYPFGEEATAFNQDTERMKFTGHERDLASPSGPGDDLDYMHARHESPVTGRFLSVDSAEANPLRPQSLNRYSYALGNPQLLVDPNGRNPALIVLAVAIVYGALSSAEAANAPESRDTKMIPSGGAARALDGGGKAAVVYLAVKSFLGALGIDSGEKPEIEDNRSQPKKGSEGGPGAGKRFSEKTRQATFDENTKCVFCGKETATEKGPDQGEVDHAIPRSRDGNNSPDNAQTTCRTCNRQKGALTTDEYMDKIKPKPPV